MKKLKIKLPTNDYQPSKAEMLKEYDMPGMSLEEVRKTFFRPVEIEREDKSKKGD